APLMNDKAEEYGAKYSFPVTSGADVHILDVFGSGMLFPDKLRDINDFIAHVMGRNCELVRIQ
ncbi:MAG: hypothetical protein MJ094_06750, partial [Saccharofermentans sp.]|nr:hypothetical protein [Saccharofermentans sp.]